MSDVQLEGCVAVTADSVVPLRQCCTDLLAHFKTWSIRPEGPVNGCRKLVLKVLGRGFEGAGHAQSPLDLAREWLAAHPAQDQNLQDGAVSSSGTRGRGGLDVAAKPSVRILCKELVEHQLMLDCRVGASLLRL